MRELTKNQVAALREQYPVGSRIRLIRMNDPYHPVPPGTKGTLVAIDDMGTFHVNWDNGRGLGLVPGEDQFEVTPLETLKLYMPLSARIHERSEWGELDDWGTEMDSMDLLPYESQINRAMRDNDLPAEKTRGLIHWYEDTGCRRAKRFGGADSDGTGAVRRPDPSFPFHQPDLPYGPLPLRTWGVQ